MASLKAYIASLDSNATIPIHPTIGSLLTTINEAQAYCIMELGDDRDLFKIMPDAAARASNAGRAVECSTLIRLYEQARNDFQFMMSLDRFLMETKTGMPPRQEFLTWVAKTLHSVKTGRAWRPPLSDEIRDFEPWKQQVFSKGGFRSIVEGEVLQRETRTDHTPGGGNAQMGESAVGRRPPVNREIPTKIEATVKEATPTEKEMQIKVEKSS